MTLRRLFDFRGETGRLRFLCGFVGWWTAFILVAVALATWGPGPGRPPSPAVLAGFFLGLVAHSAGLLALQSRRLRSLGAPAPVVIAGAFLVLGWIDILALTKLTWLRMTWPMTGMTPLAGMAQLTLHLFLFLWPAQRDEAAADLAETFA
ncbi:hypothetical protein [Phenylobacterium sp.]|jgi:uncharacterized membrane protein YhaH (DUF805 family)|uniref:hypothetical protein n=1 Tax=Phenylobacterium sp. TaxID=1871053 RepID=UPI002E2EAA0B|nr:hypothetical protein [Phenylobacterium sp.]HEX2561457.1 hypothetical protein [Phenylobacterium sp.]